MGEECFICCSKSGKTEQDKIMELMGKKKKFDYPLIVLSEAYGCECKTKSHNKCLKGINKCPTCRKIVSKPNLYVKTRLDFYFHYLFLFLKSNPEIIKWIKWIGSGLLIVLISIFICVDTKIININDIDTKFFISMSILLYIQLFAGFILALEDYFVKFWLYDTKTGIICG